MEAKSMSNSVKDAPPAWYLAWPCWEDMDCHCSAECSAKIEKQELALEKIFHEQQRELDRHDAAAAARAKAARDRLS